MVFLFLHLRVNVTLARLITLVFCVSLTCVITIENIIWGRLLAILFHIPK